MTDPNPDAGTLADRVADLQLWAEELAQSRLQFDAELRALLAKLLEEATARAGVASPTEAP